MKNPARWPGLCGSMSGFLFAPDPFVYFLPVHRHLFGCRGPESDLIAFDIQNGDLDVVANLEGFSWSPCEYQHESFLLAVVYGNGDLITVFEALG